MFTLFRKLSLKDSYKSTVKVIVVEMLNFIVASGKIACLSNNRIAWAFVVQLAARSYKNKIE